MNNIKNPTDSPAPDKAVFVSRIKFPVSLTKASQGDKPCCVFGFDTRNFILLRNCEAL